VFCAGPEQLCLIRVELQTVCGHPVADVHYTGHMTYTKMDEITLPSVTINLWLTADENGNFCDKLHINNNFTVSYISGTKGSACLLNMEHLTAAMTILVCDIQTK